MVYEIHCVYRRFTKRDFMRLPSGSWILSNSYNIDMTPVANVEVPSTPEAREQLWRKIGHDLSGRIVTNFLTEQALLDQIEHLLSIYSAQTSKDGVNA